MTRDFVKESNGRDCKHGRLARSCEICETAVEIAYLRTKLAAALRVVEAARNFQNDAWNEAKVSDEVGLIDAIDAYDALRKEEK